MQAKKWNGQLLKAKGLGHTQEPEKGPRSGHTQDQDQDTESRPRTWVKIYMQDTDPDHES